MQHQKVIITEIKKERKKIAPKEINKEASRLKSTHSLYKK